MSVSDHPFSHYLRILGKGPKSRRPLTEEEASDALSMILAGDVTDKQLGAFLLLMRANGETPSELIGFVKGLRKTLGLESTEDMSVDLDWSSYAGKWRYPPYYLLSVKLLVQNGFRICLHGDDGQFNNRHYAQSFLEDLGAYEAKTLHAAKQHLANGEMVYLPLTAYAPQLRDILHLKSELGVRTVFNTAVKLLNPLNAPCAIQGIFHKGVENLHHSAALALGTPKNLVFKGEGGEAEIRPDALTNLFVSRDAQPTEAPESIAFKGIIERQTRPKSWEPSDVMRLWRGEGKDIYGEGAVIATTASALMLMKDLPIEDAVAQARVFWLNRQN
ncbi:glycosyl transferase family protein [Hydrogenovibrio kuenenii]|uniref:glycosyl transferase family protein n=1 Tax=Hydrogenovibrio kuenenii TaxID=63658 RepID=UPI0004674C6B|nr:glycosyl transferase family protein [Hydrogenovibrio kuenenii]